MNNYKIIVCVNLSNSIGNDNNGLLYNIKNDLKHFKELTSGNIIVMGKNTYDSLPNGCLPNRVNVVMSKKLSSSQDNFLVAHSFSDVNDICKKYPDKDCFIIGGGSIYEQAIQLGLCDTIYMTLVEDTYDGLIKFPELNKSDWKEVDRERYFDEKNKLYYNFITLIKNK